MLVAASVPNERKRSFISGSAIAFPISAFRRCTMSRGVPAGASTACHVETAKPGSADSASVGNSGATAERFAVVTAIARSFPALTRLITSEMLANITCALPASRSCTAGGPPL